MSSESQITIKDIYIHDTYFVEFTVSHPLVILGMLIGGAAAIGFLIWLIQGLRRRD